MEYPPQGASPPSWPIGGGEMGALMRAHDWAGTSLGAVTSWPQSLHTAVDLVLGCAFPMVILWGPAMVQLYNDGYRTLMGNKHPAGLGQSTRDCWPEVWHINDPIYQRVWAGETLTFADSLYPITRHGILEDAWFTLCYSPLLDEGHAIAGVLVTVFESTARLYAEREHAKYEAVLRAGEVRQTFLLRLSDAVRPLINAVAIEGEACRLLGEHLQTDRTYYVTIDDDRQVAIVARDYVRGAIPSLAGEHPLAAFAAVLEPLRAGQPMVCADALTDPSISDQDRSAYLERALRSFIAAPIIKEGRLVSAMSLTLDVPRVWQPDEVALVQDVADRTWEAVERARAEAALRASEERFRTIVNLVPDLLWTADPTGAIITYNDHWLAYTGQTAAETQDSGWLAAIHPDDRAAAQAAFATAFATGQALEREQRIRRHDGNYRWFLIRHEPICDEVGQITQWLGAATDIHEQRAEREDLAEQVAVATTQLRALSQQLLLVQEEERRYLARELHDEVGQMLTGLQLQLVAAQRTWPSAEPGALDEAVAIARDLTAWVSALSMELRPSVLDTLGLVPALLWYCDRYQKRTGIHVDFHHNSRAQRLPPPSEIAIYRIVQEALTNIARHAGVSEALVHLLVDEEGAIVTIRDAGHGFDRATTRSAGGIGGMRERMDLLGGTFHIETAPGQGTTITATLPLTNATGAEGIAP